VHFEIYSRCKFTRLIFICSRNFEGPKDRAAARKRAFERKTDANEHLMSTLSERQK